MTYNYNNNNKNNSYNDNSKPDNGFNNNHCINIIEMISLNEVTLVQSHQWFSNTDTV